MLEIACLIHFTLTALTAWPGAGGPLVAPGVYAHGFIGVLCFSYTIFLHFLLSSERYGASAPGLRHLLALLSLILAGGALLGNTLIASGAGLGYLLLTGVLLVRFGKTANRREDLFLHWAVIISLLCWVYFLYALNFDWFHGLRTRFSYSLLAFSFPMSLLLFSRYVDLLQISARHVRLTALVLVGGVLSMFAGMLLAWSPLELASAGLLLLLITVYLVRAGQRRKPFLLTAFIGLLLTGLTGIWYLLSYVMGYGPETAIIRSSHAHLAHFSWATFGIYYLLLREAEFHRNHRYMLPALVPLLLSLALLLAHMFTTNSWLLPLAVFLFLSSGILPVRAHINAQQ